MRGKVPWISYKQESPKKTHGCFASRVCVCVDIGYQVDFESIWDAGNLVSIALLAAMKTNKTVRNLCVDSLEEPYLTAIVGTFVQI